MPIVGFNFDKILAEKKAPISKELRIKPNVTLKDVKVEEINLGGKDKQKLLKITYEFLTEYNPKIGTIQIEGHILYSGDQKEIDDMAKNWKKDKKIDDDNFVHFINTILVRGNIKALSLAQDVNLPPQLNLPRVTKKVNPKDYIG